MSSHSDKYLHQILVHVSAPSSASDDARYRAQVAAIRAMMQPAEAEPEAAPEDVPCLPADQSASETRHCVHDPETISAKASTPIGGHSISSRDSLGSIVSVIPDSQPSDPNSQTEAQVQAQPLQDTERRQEPSPKRRRTESESTSTSVPGQTTRLSPELQISHPPIHHSISTQDYTILLRSLPVEIRPPPPPISTGPFTTHVTPTLAMLVDRLNPARTYRPVCQVRALDKLERGYWAVQIGIRPDPLDAGTTGTRHEPYWNGELFARFWGFLRGFVGEARAGWGVWCFLDRGLGEQGQGQGQIGGLEVLLKVYAWGEVAVHVYLLLFLASERRVRGMGARWVDSREEMVIQMP